MLLPRLGALLLAARCAQAFKNTSPFLFLSSDPLRIDAPLRSWQLGVSTDVETKLIETLEECDKKFYYIFTQDGVSASHLKAGAMPKLEKSIANAEDSSVVEIPEIIARGDLTATSIQARLEKACAAKGKKSLDSWPEGDDVYQIISMALPTPPTDAEARSKVLRDTDDGMEGVVEAVLSGKNPSVLIYLTTPVSEYPERAENAHLYEMDDPYPSALHTDLKRDLRRQSDSANNLALFETYQFLTPGIFMGLSVSIVLFLILYTGISAIAGLEVSYFAFSKEMGNQAQKKQQ